MFDDENEAYKAIMSGHVMNKRSRQSCVCCCVITNTGIF